MERESRTPLSKILVHHLGQFFMKTWENQAQSVTVNFVSAFICDAEIFILELVSGCIHLSPMDSIHFLRDMDRHDQCHL